MHCDALQSRDTYKEYMMSRSLPLVVYSFLFCSNACLKA